MPTASEADLKLLFTDARTHMGWLPRPIEDSTLRQIYELARMGPTAANAQPLRVVFVKSAAAKERLRPSLSPGNLDKTMAAPAVAIIAADRAFHEKMPKLFPARGEQLRESMGKMDGDKRERFLLQNSSLQAAFFILAARALGLDCGPMGGFDSAKVDAAFFPDGKWTSNLLVNLGYGDASKLHPRNPRLDFDEACRIE